MYELEIWNSGSSNTLTVQLERNLTNVTLSGLINNNYSPPIHFVQYGGSGTAARGFPATCNLFFLSVIYE